MIGRYLISRRAIQAAVILLFFGSAHWGWNLAGAPLLRGNLSASQVAGVVPLADPFAVLQILATGHALESRALLGAACVLLFWGIVGGRSFCAWVCPMNPVSDLAGWLRRRLALDRGASLDRRLRLWMLALSLALSAMTGVAAFEWISPIGMLQRALIFGLGAAWVAVGALFLFDLLLARQGWCGHLCPLGACYGLVGRVAQVRVAFDAASCTHCGQCHEVCAEPHVLNLKEAANAGMVASGDCTNCGRCITVCPETSLAFAWRHRCVPALAGASNPHPRR